MSSKSSGVSLARFPSARSRRPATALEIQFPRYLPWVKADFHDAEDENEAQSSSYQSASCMMSPISTASERSRIRPLKRPPYIALDHVFSDPQYQGVCIRKLMHGHLFFRSGELGDSTTVHRLAHDRTRTYPSN